MLFIYENKVNYSDFQPESTIADNGLVAWECIHNLDNFCLLVVVSLAVVIKPVGKTLAKVVGVVLVPEITQEILTSV
jgi:hypothetical protein